MTTAVALTKEMVETAYNAAWHHMTKGKVYQGLDAAAQADAGKYLCSLFYGPQPGQQPVSDEVATEMQRRFAMSCHVHGIGSGLPGQTEPWYGQRAGDVQSYMAARQKGAAKKKDAA